MWRSSLRKAEKSNVPASKRNPAVAFSSIQAIARDDYFVPIEGNNVLSVLGSPKQEWATEESIHQDCATGQCNIYLSVGESLRYIDNGSVEGEPLTLCTVIARASRTGYC